MRVVVFTELTEGELSTWWDALARMPALSAVLVCRQSNRLRSDTSKGTRVWRYVLDALLLTSPHRRQQGPDRSKGTAPPPSALPVERWEAPSLGGPETIARVTAWQPDIGICLRVPFFLGPALFAIPTRGTLSVRGDPVLEAGGVSPAYQESCAGANEIIVAARWIGAETTPSGASFVEATAPVYGSDTPSSIRARTEELARWVLAEALKRVAAGDVAGATLPSGRQVSHPRPSRIPRSARRVARAFAPRTMAKAVASVLTLWTYRPVRDLLRTLTRTHPLRIFTFHRVSNLCRDGMTVAPSVLERQIEHICQTHDVVTLAEALHMVRDGRRLRRPAALLTFDDGYRSVYDLARPALARHGVVGCCFVTTDLVGTDRRFPHDDANPVRPMLDVMTWKQVRSLAEAGWAIGSHSASHARLSACHGEALRHEIVDSLRAVTAQIGEAETAIAYPFGGREDISPQALEQIRTAGYAACFSDVFGETPLPYDPFALRRIEMGGDHGTLAWKLWAHGLTLAPFRR